MLGTGHHNNKDDFYKLSTGRDKRGDFYNNKDDYYEMKTGNLVKDKMDSYYMTTGNKVKDKNDFIICRRRHQQYQIFCFVKIPNTIRLQCRQGHQKI